MLDCEVRTRVRGMSHICLVLNAEKNLVWEKLRAYFILL